LLLFHACVAKADTSLEVFSSIFYRHISVTVATISAYFIDIDCIIQKYLLKSTNCGVFRGKIIFTMFFLTFPLLLLNVLLLPAESEKADPKKYVNKEAQQESKVSFR
jgi:hypothetical protein